MMIDDEIRSCLTELADPATYPEVQLPEAPI
jgi:hypothetical protein